MNIFTVKVTQPPDPASGLSHFITTFSPSPAPVMHVSTPKSYYMSNAEAAHQAAEYAMQLIRKDIEEQILAQLNELVPEAKIAWKDSVPMPTTYVSPDTYNKLTQIAPYNPSPLPSWMPGGFGGASVTSTLVSVFPGLAAARAASPCTKSCPWAYLTDAALTELVVHLNDEHKWSRDEIADWLDTLDIDLSAKPNTEKETAA